MTDRGSLTTIKNKAYDIHNIQDIVTTYNQQLADAFYISTTIDLPAKKDMAHCYRSGSDFSLKTREEVESLTSDTAIEKNNNSDFFVYNERTKEIVPFQKHDCLMYDTWYFTYNGNEYVTYDDGGNEIKRFMLDKHQQHKK